MKFSSVPPLATDLIILGVSLLITVQALAYWIIQLLLPIIN